MRSQIGNTVLSKSRQIGAESNNPCYLNLPVRKDSRSWRELRRRDLTNAFVARFHTKYNTSDGCWLWQAGQFPKGYGMVNLGRNHLGQQHTEYAHRVAYVLAHGPVPAGAVVMHSCDTPACVNPNHLALGTQADNVHDAAQKGHYSVPHRSDSQARKLTNGDVNAIRMSFATGDALAKCYGVSKTTISLIRRGLRRKAA